jgi:hypothetical protein
MRRCHGEVGDSYRLIESLGRRATVTWDRSRASLFGNGGQPPERTVLSGSATASRLDLKSSTGDLPVPRAKCPLQQVTAPRILPVQLTLVLAR